MEKIDRRTIFTQNAVKEAFFKILEKKHIGEISVTEICDAAGINRATFYRNYSDIYDLFEKIENSLTESAFESGDIEKDRFTLLEVIYKNRVFYREFFESGLESSFIRKTVKSLFEKMKALLASRGTYDERTFKISFWYNYYGATGVIKEWVSSGCAQSPEDFGNALYSVVEKQYGKY